MTEPLDDVGSTTRRSDLAPGPAPSSADDGATVTRSSLRAGAGSAATGPADRVARRGRRRRVALPALGRRGTASADVPAPGRGRTGREALEGVRGHPDPHDHPAARPGPDRAHRDRRAHPRAHGRAASSRSPSPPAAVWQPVLDVLRWVSPLGWSVLLVGLVAWWLTARYQWVELSMVAAACLVLVLACLALAIGRAKVRISVDVEPTRVTVGDPATGRIEVVERLRAGDAAAARRAARRRDRRPLHAARPRRRAAPTRSSSSSRPGTAASSRSARPRRCTATRSASSGAPSRGPSAPSCSSTR